MTLELTIASMAPALLVGVPLGVVAASGSRLDRVTASIFTIARIGIPDLRLRPPPLRVQDGVAEHSILIWSDYI